MAYQTRKVSETKARLRELNRIIADNLRLGFYFAIIDLLDERRAIEARLHSAKP